MSDGVTSLAGDAHSGGRRDPRSRGNLPERKQYIILLLLYARAERERPAVNDDNARPTRCERRLYVGHVGQVAGAASRLYIRPGAVAYSVFFTANGDRV